MFAIAMAGGGLYRVVQSILVAERVVVHITSCK